MKNFKCSVLLLLSLFFVVPIFGMYRTILPKIVALKSLRRGCSSYSDSSQRRVYIEAFYDGLKQLEKEHKERQEAGLKGLALVANKEFTSKNSAECKRLLNELLDDVPPI